MHEDIGKFLRSAKKLSKRTRELYGKHLRTFADWCQARGIDDLANVTPEMVESYLESRKRWSSSTKWSGLCAIRRIARWKLGEDHPLVRVSMERTSSPPQRTLNKKQSDTLLQLFDTTRPKGIRDLAIVTLLLDTGLRAAELVSIELEHLDMEEGVLFVTVKGGEWEPAAFFEYTHSCLSRWLGVRDTIANPGVNTLFVSVGGLTAGQPITRDGLRAIFRRFSLGSELGLISPHDLRRTFATLALKAGAPTRVVQVAGRWKNIKMVELYSRALRVKAVHRYSPVNFLMGVKPRVVSEE